MDKTAEVNCSLKNLQLTQVFFANGTELSKTVWSSIFLFDIDSKKLTVTKYAGLNTTDFNQTRLLFQSKIADDLPALTKAWHFINVTVNEVLVKEEPKPVPGKPEKEIDPNPHFAIILQPIYVAQDFS